MGRSVDWLAVCVCLVVVLAAGCDETDESGESTATSSASAVVEPPVPANRLSGLYLRMVSSYNGRTFSFVEEHHYFSPDGHVYFGVPKGGLEQFNWNTADPKRTGTYEIVGGTLTITWKSGEKPRTYKFVRKADGNIELDGLFASRREKFAPDTKLDGTYSWAGIAGGGTGAVVSSGRSYSFKPDGTFSQSSVGGASVSVNGQTVSGQSAGALDGTYTLSGHTLTLKRSDGSIERHTVYPFEDLDGHTQISIDGTLMNKPR